MSYIVVKNTVHQEISKYEKQYRGKELPGFVNYKTFEIIVQQYLQQLVDPALEMLQKAVGEGPALAPRPAPRPRVSGPPRARQEWSFQTQPAHLLGHCFLRRGVGESI